jgi:cytochrome c551/c552
MNFPSCRFSRFVFLIHALRHALMDLAKVKSLSFLVSVFLLGISTQLTVLPFASFDLQEKRDDPIEVDDPATEIRPGLVASYRSLAADQRSQFVTRIDPKPAYTWGVSTPHPRIAPGPFEVIWRGLIDLRTNKPIRWGAFVSGQVSVRIGKTIVLDGMGKDLNDRIDSQVPYQTGSGLYEVEIRYQSLSEVPARLQIWWEGKTFAREPLPASRLKHLVRQEPGTLKEESAVEKGRLSISRLGCARCHQSSFLGIDDVAPGPALTKLQDRIDPEWLMNWLENPAQLRREARMPTLFAADKTGYAERWLITRFLLKPEQKEKQPTAGTTGDHRAGKQAFLGLGCIACHFDPEKNEPASIDSERYPLTQLTQRMNQAYLTSFLKNPLERYPDGRMPKMPLTYAMACDITAYLWQISPPKTSAATDQPRPAELDSVLQRLGASEPAAAGRLLLQQKGCVQCHTGLEGIPSKPLFAKKLALTTITGGGCASKSQLPRYTLDESTCHSISAYLAVASTESHASPFAQRQRLLQQSGCFRCHQRDTDRPAPLVEIGQNLWTPHLYRLPFQRTPPLTQASAKFKHSYLLSALRDGVQGIRPDWYSYRMPTYGDKANELVQALAEGDGDLIPTSQQIENDQKVDPNVLAQGPTLIGFNGYGCVSCHIWNGQSLSATEPSSVGPDLTTVHQRINRSWFERYLDDPQRIYPGSPMPSIFKHGEAAPIQSILAGDVAKQKEALWAYFALGKNAPGPQPKPPLIVHGPNAGEPPFTSQIPVELPNKTLLEALILWTDKNDFIVYDVSTGQLHSIYPSASLLRQANTWRTYQLTGRALNADAPIASLHLLSAKGAEAPTSISFLGYDLLPNGMKFRQLYRFASGEVQCTESIHVELEGMKRILVRDLQLEIPKGKAIVLQLKRKGFSEIQSTAQEGQLHDESTAEVTKLHLEPAASSGRVRATLRLGYAANLETHKSNQVPISVQPTDEGNIGPLQRPGYRAILYPRPKTYTGEDLVMPSALATDPKTGRLFIASMKQGDLFVLDDPNDNGKNAQYRPYARGLFQDCFGMVHDGQALYVLHRRNLTRLIDSDSDGFADRSERVTALPHAIGNAYDWAYGLLKNSSGRFYWTLAPHANPNLIGSGTLAEGVPGSRAWQPRELAFGFRNPLGWAIGEEGQVFFTDNQGDWVATNKLCHIVPGQYYGYPNNARPQDRTRPMAKTAVWVPYDWAKSINGMAYDATEGKFGPFAGQFFLAELMHGGAIVRAQVEKVNGVYQGACFPFWGEGLLGPLTMAFDPKGRLWVGSITTPGWMGQPDRGALFRIDFTGQPPFEMQRVHIQPQGFRIVFTKPIDVATAGKLDSYHIEHYRYEYTGAYGSPELDRTRLAIQQVRVQPDGKTVDLLTALLSKDRVYAISAPGIRSLQNEALVHSLGVYTVNEIPER